MKVNEKNKRQCRTQLKELRSVLRDKDVSVLKREVRYYIDLIHQDNDNLTPIAFTQVSGLHKDQLSGPSSKTCKAFVGKRLKPLFVSKTDEKNFNITIWHETINDISICVVFVNNSKLVVPSCL